MIEKISDAKFNENLYFLEQIIQNGGKFFLKFEKKFLTICNSTERILMKQKRQLHGS